MDKTKIKNRMNEPTKEPEVKIRAPWFNTIKWKDIFVPEEVRENPYMKAYLSTKQFQLRILILLVAIISFVSGYYQGR